MLGMIVKIGSRQTDHIGQTKSIRLDPKCINRIRSDRKVTSGEYAIIGVVESGRVRQVALTGLVSTVSVGEPVVNLKYLRVYKKPEQWALPRGYAETDGFQEGFGERLESEGDVLCCLVKQPASLLPPNSPKMPVGFHWNPSAAACAVVSFDGTGSPILHSKNAYDSAVIGDFGRYRYVLGGIWERMSGHDFQSAMKEMFVGLGFRVIAGGVGSDGGIDLSLYRDDPIVGMDIYVVQCKRYHPSRPISSDSIDGLRGAALSRNAQRCIYVTTSKFSNPARQKAEGPGLPVQLIDGADLGRIILPRIAGMATIQRFL